MVGERTVAPFQLDEKSRAGVRNQLELYSHVRLRLHDNGPSAHVAAEDRIADADLHLVATAQLAVEGKIEQRSITQAAMLIENKAKGSFL